MGDDDMTDDNMRDESEDDAEEVSNMKPDNNETQDEPSEEGAVEDTRQDTADDAADDREQEQQDAAGETDASAEPETATADPVRSWIEQVEREDIVLFGLLGALIVAAVYGYAGMPGLPGSGSHPDADPDTVAYCEETADAIETNATFSGPDTSCDCLPPGTFDPSRYQVAQKLDDATELFLVRCEDPRFDEPITFPVRRVTDESANVSTTVPETSKTPETGGNSSR